MFLHKLKQMKNKVAMAIAGGLVGLMACPPLVAFAQDSYFMAVTIDSHNYSVISYVDFDDSGVGKAKEVILGNFSSLTDWKKKADLPQPNGKVLDNKALTKDDFKTFSKDASNKNTLVFTFPGIHNIRDAKANDSDLNQANLISQTIGNSLNQAVEDIRSSTKNYAFKDVNEYCNLLRLLAYNSTITGSTGSTTYFNLNGQTFSIQKGNNAGVPLSDNQLNKDDYITISTDGFKNSYPYKFPKGYKKGQFLYDKHPTWDSDDLKEIADKDTDYITWNDLVVQGEYNLYVKGYSYDNIKEIVKPGKVEQIFTDILSSLLRQVRSLLGLYNVQDLVFNGGNRAVSYYKGIMPNSWYNNAKIFHMVCQAIAWILISGALVKMLIEKNLSTINPVMRVNMIENIKNLLLTGVLLLLALPIFSLLATLNQQLVAIFSSSTATTMSALDFMLSGRNGENLLGNVVIGIAFFIVLIYLNFVYIVRGLMVAILLATAPLYIVSIAFGSKYKGLFSNWSRELVANIFLQTFHAIIFAFFAMPGFI